jgi:hypothetical protein
MPVTHTVVSGSSMTVVDYIDLDDDDCYVKVDFVDLSTDEDNVEKDCNVPEDVSVSRSESVAKAAVSLSISEQAATPTTSLSKLEQEHAATASLSMVEHGATTSPVMAEETMQPEHQKFLATSDVAKEATCSGNHGLIAAGDLVGEARKSVHGADAFVFSSMTEQGDSTSLLLVNQFASSTLSFREDNAILSGNQAFVTVVDCANEATQFESIPKAAGSSSITERNAMGVNGDAGNSMSSTRTYNIHAQEESEGNTDKNENCDFEAEPVALCGELSQDVLAMCLPPQDKEKEISQCTTSARECNRQLRHVHSKGVLPTLHDGVSEFSVMPNVRAGTSSIGISVFDGEVVASTYQGCSKTPQGNTMDLRVRDSGSEGCVVEGCTNGAHGGTHLCIFHYSWPHKRCCAAIGCTTGACKSIRGRIGCCVKHGGGKRCKYDGCGKGAQGNTDFCIAHGGGRRCKFGGCGSSAQGRSDYCVKHGGGKRCKFLGCMKSAVGRSDYCLEHGGGRRCKFQGCSKCAQGRSDYCVKHGGGRGCTFQGCSKSARGRSDYCVEHGGGRRCKFLGCSASATCGKDLCSIHITGMLSGNNCTHEMLPAPACWAKKAGRSKGRNSPSMIGGRAQKRQNTNGYINTRSFSVVEV